MQKHGEHGFSRVLCIRSFNIDPGAVAAQLRARHFLSPRARHHGLDQTSSLSRALFAVRRRHVESYTSAASRAVVKGEKVSRLAHQAAR